MIKLEPMIKIEHLDKTFRGKTQTVYALKGYQPGYSKRGHIWNHRYERGRKEYIDPMYELFGASDFRDSKDRRQGSGGFIR